MPIPNMNLNQTAQSGAGGGNSVGGATSDWIVSYGGAANVGGAMNVPTWVWVALAVGGLLWLKRKG